MNIIEKKKEYEQKKEEYFGLAQTFEICDCLVIRLKLQNCQYFSNYDQKLVLYERTQPKNHGGLSKICSIYQYFDYILVLLESFWGLRHVKHIYIRNHAR